jgi:hypothetical protein
MSETEQTELDRAIDALAAETGADRTDLADRAVLERSGWRFGERVRMLDDQDPFQAGEEGHVVIQEVGSAEFNNRRVAVFFMVEGTDAWDEVDPSNLESA